MTEWWIGKTSLEIIGLAIGLSGNRCDRYRRACDFVGLQKESGHDTQRGP
jgi:hypothetical protein